MAIDAVVFDIGNVLIEWQPEHYFDRHFGQDRRKALFANVDLHGMNDRIDAGANFYTELAATEAAHPGYAREIRAWRDNWIQLASPVIPVSVRLLRALRTKGVPVFCLTNFGVETFEQAASIYSFLNEFDQSYISGRLGVIKPDPRIYAAVETGSGIAPDGLLFTDDRAENIAAARARGWRVHHFQGAQGWGDCLVAHGLLRDEQTRG